MPCGERRGSTPPQGLQRAVFVLDGAFRPHVLPRQAPAALVVRAALHAPVQQDPAGQRRRQADLLVAALAPPPRGSVPVIAVASPWKMVQAAVAVGRSVCQAGHLELVVGVQGKRFIVESPQLPGSGNRHYIPGDGASLDAASIWSINQCSVNHPVTASPAHLRQFYQ